MAGNSNNSFRDVEFSCSLPHLSASNVTDHEFWTISNTYLFGTPLAAVLKFLLIFILFIIYIPLIILAVAQKRFRRNRVYILIFINHSATSVLLALVLLIFSVVFEFSRDAEFMKWLSSLWSLCICWVLIDTIKHGTTSQCGPTLSMDLYSLGTSIP